MIINLKNIKINVLNYENDKRKEHILKNFKNEKLIFFNGFSHIKQNKLNKNKSGAIGFSQILDSISQNQKYNTLFSPEIILEDDVSKFREFPENITIPDNTDIIYIGISKFGIKSNKSSKQIYCENINDNIVKIYNMLSMHGIIICSIRGLISLQKCFLESYYTDKIWDNYTAKIQPILNVYALKQPLIYQDKSVGGIENDTKFSINSINNKTLDMENTITNLSMFIKKDYIEERLFFINNIFSKLGNIEKKIHISWKEKNIMDLNLSLIKNGIRKVKDLNPDFTFEISDDNDIEIYIKDNIHEKDYNLIKDRHIVEKTDLWRLLKIYNEGGFYQDIDRPYNTPLERIIKKFKQLLPMYLDIDFSQDIMLSCSKNIIFKKAIELNLKRRREGCKDTISLGPKTYFHAVTEVLLGKQINRYPNKNDLTNLRTIITQSPYLHTFREDPKFNLLTYQGDKINFNKQKFYNHFNVKHWTKDSNDILSDAFGR